MSKTDLRKESHEISPPNIAVIHIHIKSDLIEHLPKNPHKIRFIKYGAGMQEAIKED